MGKLRIEKNPNGSTRYTDCDTNVSITLDEHGKPYTVGGGTAGGMWADDFVAAYENILARVIPTKDYRQYQHESFRAMVKRVLRGD